MRYILFKNNSNSNVDTVSMLDLDIIGIVNVDHRSSTKQLLNKEFMETFEFDDDRIVYISQESCFPNGEARIFKLFDQHDNSLYAHVCPDRSRISDVYTSQSHSGDELVNIKCPPAIIKKDENE